MKPKLKEKEEARRLRQDSGLSIGKIAKQLNVSQSSVSIWVRDIVLSDKQKEQLNQNKINGQLEGVRKQSQYQKIKRQTYQKTGFDEATGESLHIMGCMLYWAEGSNGRNGVALANTDKVMIKLFLRFLRQYFNVNDEQIIITCYSHILSKFDLQEVEKYWINILDLPTTCLRKGYTRIGIAKRKKMKYPYGVCTISIHSTEIAQRIFGSIKKYSEMTLDDKWL